LTKPEPHPRNAPIEYLFAAIVAMVGFLASAMSAHMVTIMAAFGIAASAAVAVAALRGVAQTAARLAEIVFGARLSPVALGLVATAFLPASFVAAGLTGVSIVFGAGFALLYGAGNGLATIVRGTLPLALFGSTGYGARVGRLVAPGFFLAAAAPTIFALVMEWGGAQTGIALGLAVASATFVAMLMLTRIVGRHR
jgi:hypothetical protein